MPVVGQIAAVVGTAQAQSDAAVRRRLIRRRAVAKPRVKEQLDDNELGWNDLHTRFSVVFRRTRDNAWFQAAILAAVLVAAVIVGVNTYDLSGDEHLATTLAVLDEVVIGTFLMEVFVKLFAEGRRPWEYFRDRWNCLDFSIVSLSLVPQSGKQVTVFFLARLLRLLKVVRALPKLRVLVVGLLRSLSSIAYIGLLLVMLFFIFGVVGTTAFGDNDPRNFGTLHVSVLTLFRATTLEDWSQIMYTQLYGCDSFGYDNDPTDCTDPSPSPAPFVVLYFLLFVVVSAFMILNLFIGVILRALEEAREDLLDEMKHREALKEAEARRRTLPPALQDGALSFIGSLLDRRTAFAEEEEMVERLVELRDVVDFAADELDHLRHVELDRWVRKEERRIDENMAKLRKVKKLTRAVRTFARAAQEQRELARQRRASPDAGGEGGPPKRRRMTLAALGRRNSSIRQLLFGSPARIASPGNAGTGGQERASMAAAVVAARAVASPAAAGAGGQEGAAVATPAASRYATLSAHGPRGTRRFSAIVQSATARGQGSTLASGAAVATAQTGAAVKYFVPPTAAQAPVHMPTSKAVPPS
eukprot:CAMPEP_0196799402 /NCGR_PEP_ID=MMETSP1104-20130614/39624_1 /TAXON_ID=33652 /ORGANISM="Cafeteria sp., Strain Caron Lab Isolate" /LENGTH=585 /DNA_ID=CAMNT_0042169811 /DNA_START=101 /DNA_END=1854 /DNA_ORIENTATION=+